MKVELFPFQKSAVAYLRMNTAEALGSYRRTHTPQVVSFTAPTGSGKTIIMATLMEDIFFGTEGYEDQLDAIFVWLSDSPQLNAQSRQKIDLKADKIRLDQCVTIDESTFDMEFLEEGHIYFLNTQKLGQGGKLTQHSDARTYTIWETLQNTVRDKSDRLYFIIDEAHRGMQGREAGIATSIMQRFLKGSPVNHLGPMPVVIGMSATTQRFNQLVEGTTSTVHKVIVTAAEVRASGLLKDRIIITYPEDANSHSDMAVLQAATDEWKDKCLHWYQYSYEQHYAQVNPIFVIQTLNSTGNGATDTDIGECIARIEERSGWRLLENEVVHTFGQTAAIRANGLTIPHVEPSEIADDKRIRVVFFKENLSTGWDCPRAETMMSFRRAEDATYIAQLLGRMVRTPLQMHIQVDESLNDVHLYLPYFNAETVKNVIDELQNTEGGEIPTVIEGESLEKQIYTTWTTRTSRQGVAPLVGQTEMQLPSFVPVADTNGLSNVFGDRVPGSNTVPSDMKQTPFLEVHPQQEHPQAVLQQDAVQSPVIKQSEPGVQIDMNLGNIDRDAVVRFINDLGLLTYEVKLTRIYSHLVSLLKLARLLTQSGIAPQTEKSVEADIVKMIREYIEKLKAERKYESYAKRVMEFKMFTQIFDVFGESVDNYCVHDLYTKTDTDLDRQVRVADSKLGNIGISNAYGRSCYDDNDPYGFKVDVILFAADNDNLVLLNRFAEAKFHQMNDNYRLQVVNTSDRYRKQYHDIIADGDEVSKHNFRLPETLRVRCDRDGKKYKDHLFVDEESGEATIKLNGWEEGVLAEEAKRPDFVCWLRNPSRESWSLCLPYEIGNDTKATYPDFIVIRNTPSVGYVVGILEPHSQAFVDNLGKAKAFAQYAKDEDRIGRIQLIRMSTDSAGKNRFKRLDMAKSAVRNKVLRAQANDELDHIFDTDGAFE